MGGTAQAPTPRHITPAGVEVRLGFVNSVGQQTASRSPQPGGRFDAGTAEGLAELIADVDDPARLAEVSDWIVGCATGDVLLERCSSLRDRRPPGSS